MADHREESCVDGETVLHPPLMAVSKVLDDENLLRLIMVRVGFPTSLVCAALVCKRWFGVASDPGFLCGFRKLHPPNLLGFCVDLVTRNMRYLCPLYGGVSQRSVTFVPTLPHPAELAVVVRHLEKDMKKELGRCSSSDGFISGFWNGKSTERGMSSILPSPPNEKVQFHGSFLSSFFICQHSEGEIHGLSHVFSSVKANMRKHKVFTMNMYRLQDGSWHMHTSATTQLSYTREDPEPLLVGSKVYMRRVDKHDILVLDLTASRFFTIQLPEAVKNLHKCTMLSPADDSKVYLMHLKNLQLHIWLHNGEKNWLLVDTIYLRQLCDVPSMSDATDEDGNNAIVRVSQLGEKDEFVFLKIGQCALYLDIKRRVLRKVYEVTEENSYLSYIRPLRMIWPPIFPALKDDPARNTM